MKPARKEDFVKVFTELAQERLPDDAPPRDQSFARIQERLAASKEPAVRPWARVGGLALAAASLLGVGTWYWAANRGITYQLDNAQVAADGKLFGGSSGSRVHFSDGSQLSLWPGAQASVGELDAHGGRVRIEEGTTHVAIMHKPAAVWSLLAGPYTVRVTGTAFDIAWVNSAQRFAITMQSGSVLITGPLAPRGVTLEAGQRLRADSALTVDHAGDPDPVAAVLPEPAPPALEDSSAPPSSSSAPEHHRFGGRSSWRELVSKGKFETVLHEAEQRGISSVLSGASVSDLSALADAARYARRPDLSRQALLAQRQRFAGSPQARDAAFFLGSLGEGSGGASEWYERYLAESPSGAFASQALGRELVLAYGQHRTEDARRFAAAYNAKYPNGPYASTARKVLAEPVGVGGAGKAKVP